MSHHVRLVPTPLKSPTKTNNCHPGFSFFFEKNWRVIGTSHDAEGFNQLIKSTAQNLPFLYGSLYLSSQHLPTLTSLSLLKFHSFLSLSIYKFLHHHSPSCTRERERERKRRWRWEKGHAHRWREPPAWRKLPSTSSAALSRLIPTTLLIHGLPLPRYLPETGAGTRWM